MYRSLWTDSRRPAPYSVCRSLHLLTDGSDSGQPLDSWQIPEYRIRADPVCGLRPDTVQIYVCVKKNCVLSQPDGSGNGKTAGKGHKGQKARSGATRPGFEGGQMPLYRRIPKRGFTCRNSKTIVGINISELERFEDGATVSVETLIESGIVKNPRDGVKILGNGELTKKLTVQANAFSAKAAEKIEALGGKAEVI